MITLPSSFDYNQLIIDFFALSTPFITIAVLFAAAALIRKVVRGAA